MTQLGLVLFVVTLTLTLALPVLETSASSSLELVGSSKKILIAVVTSPNHHRARSAIRESWGQTAKNLGYDVKFFIGLVPSNTPDREELNKQIDAEPWVVRFDDFEESYHNLTAKAINIFSYGDKHGFQGVMKVDDDTFLHVNTFNGFVQSNSVENIWAGAFISSGRVNKNPGARWYGYDQYPHEYWPAYPNGPGFFLGRKAIQYISENRNSLNRIRIDDAAVGVWLQHLNLKQVSIRANIFAYNLDNDVVFDNPVNYLEMKRLENGERFALKACVEPSTACLCHGNPSVTSREHGDCWHRTSNNEYKDVIPRLASTN